MGVAQLPLGGRDKLEQYQESAESTNSGRDLSAYTVEGRHLHWVSLRQKT